LTAVTALLVPVAEHGWVHHMVGRTTVWLAAIVAPHAMRWQQHATRCVASSWFERLVASLMVLQCEIRRWRPKQHVMTDMTQQYHGIRRSACSLYLSVVVGCAVGWRFSKHQPEEILSNDQF
jgi:L-lactate permease